MTDLSAIATVSLYAGLNGLILVWLAVSVARLRAQLSIFMGDGGNAVLIRAMRGQANFIEFAPMCLILLFAMAFLGAPAWVLHLFGIVLTVGRVLHGMHFTRPEAPGWQRSAGATLSFAALVFGAVGVIGHALVAL